MGSRNPEDRYHNPPSTGFGANSARAETQRVDDGRFSRARELEFCIFQVRRPRDGRARVQQVSGTGAWSFVPCAGRGKAMRPLHFPGSSWLLLVAEVKQSRSSRKKPSSPFPQWGKGATTCGGRYWV